MMLRNGVYFFIQLLSIFSLTMSSQTKDECYELITSQLHGQFSSPKYPKVYPNNLNCKWNISVPLGYHLMLNFTQFELEWGEKCEYDFVTVKSKNGTFGKFCGQRNEIKSVAVPRDPLFIYDSNIQVNFNTDFSNEVEVHGFEAHFAAIDMDECLFNNGGCNHFCHNFIGGYYCSCKIGYQLGPDKKTCIVKCSGIDLRKMSGYIESPEYPLNYPPQAQCDWSIHAQKGYYINLQFIDFHIEDHHDSLCPFDKLEIQDEHSKKGPYCGKQPPMAYRSASNWLIVEFQSDKSQQAKGFRAKYWLEPKKCTQLFPPEFGLMDGPKNFTFKETLRFTCEPGFEYVDGTEERTCQADGTWTGKMGRCNQIICPFPRNRNYKTTIASNSDIIHHVNVSVKVICSLFYERIGSDTMVCQKNRTWSNTNTYCLKTCGMAFRRHPAIEKCSAGKHRTITRKNSQPWMVAIVEKKPGASPKIICSGVLINQEWFITVANCVAFTKERHGQKGNLEIILGNFEWDKPHQETAVRRIKKIVFRRKYDYGLHSDIVLVQMDRPVKTDFIYVQPVCLPFGKKHRHLFNNITNAATIGWYSNGDRHLTDRCVDVVDESTCQRYVQETHSKIQRDIWGSSNGRKHIIPTELMCTDASVGTNDRCKILAGSALVKFDPNNRKWYLGGILSWGHKDLNTCKRHMTSYDMYTKIDKHIKWIRMVTKVNLRYPDEKDVRASRRRKHS